MMPYWGSPHLIGSGHGHASMNCWCPVHKGLTQCDLLVPEPPNVWTAQSLYFHQHFRHNNEYFGGHSLMKL